MFPLASHSRPGARGTVPRLICVSFFFLFNSGEDTRCSKFQLWDSDNHPQPKHSAAVSFGARSTGFSVDHSSPQRRILHIHPPRLDSDRPQTRVAAARSIQGLYAWQRAIHHPTAKTLASSRATRSRTRGGHHWLLTRPPARQQPSC